MKIIGLTGGIACGKSNLSAALLRAGYAVIDADAISRALTASGGAALSALRDAFGDSIFSGAELDRRALSSIVFSDADALNRLNAILHPMIFDEINRQIELCSAQGLPIVFLDIPLLYETHAEALCDAVICAYIPQYIQLARLMTRDGISRASALRKIRSQLSSAEKKRRATYVIDTRGTREQSASKVLELARRLTGTGETE